MKHQFTDEQIRVTSNEIWDSIPPSGNVRCDVPYSHAAAVKLLDARTERDDAIAARDVALVQVRTLATAAEALVSNARAARDVALARVRELERLADTQHVAIMHLTTLTTRLLRDDVSKKDEKFDTSAGHVQRADMPDATGLLHDRVHKDLGVGRAAKSVKVKGGGGDE